MHWLVQVILSILAALSLVALYVFLNVVKHKSAKKPLRYRNHIDPVDTSKWKRRDILKDRFKINKIPDYIDYIIIGSGVSSLTCGAYLSRAGYRVLILEQHDRTGGCLHEYSSTFHFDVGIHYIGNAEEQMKYLNPICREDFVDGSNTKNDNNNTKKTKPTIDWKQMGSVEDGFTYDRLIFGDDFAFDIRAKSFKTDLKNVFDLPHEHETIDEWFRLIDRADEASFFTMAARVVPSWLAWIMLQIGAFMFPDVWRATVQDILDRVCDQKTDRGKKLAVVLTGNIGDIGGYLSEISFLMMAMVQTHYEDGGFYPVGGSAEIARKIQAGIERRGGRCLANARVTRILIDGDRAVGISLETNTKRQLNINARFGVISGIGIRNTFTQLIDPCRFASPHYERVVSSMRSSPQHFQIFIGFDGNSTELDLPSWNYWIYGKDILADGYDSYLKRVHSDPLDCDGRVIGFMGFPSAKDPKYDGRTSGKRSNCIVISDVPFEHWEEWNETSVGKRGREYEDLKEKIADYVLERTLFKHFPHVRERVVRKDIGSALTSKYYLGSAIGESYGLAHTVSRFCDHDTVKALRVETPLRKLWMTGQDVMTVGFAGALGAGYHTAMVILGYYQVSVLISGRTLLKDLEMLDEKEKENHMPRHIELGAKKVE